MTEKPQVPASLGIIDNINIQLVQQTMQKISAFQAVVKNTLKEGHDYGVVPGTGSKPTLFKPGAEKILMLLSLSSEYELIEKVLDYEKGFFAFTVKCMIYRDGRKITEGMGHANTRERRYTSGKQQDAYTLANTVLKMAKKRAQVDAVLTVASLSEIFTQDLEDLELEEEALPVVNSKATEAQIKAIVSISNGKKIDYHPIIEEKWGVSSAKELTKQQASELIDLLQKVQRTAAGA